MMVSLDSARQWYPREKLVACNANHSQIAKLKRGESGIYPSVRWAVKQAMLSAGDLYSDAVGYHTQNAANAPETAHQARPQALSLDSSEHWRSQSNSHAMGEARLRLDDTIDREPIGLNTANAIEDHAESHIPNRFPLHVGQTVHQWQSGLNDYAIGSAASLISDYPQSQNEDASSVSEVQRPAHKVSESMTSIGTEAVKPSVLNHVEAPITPANKSIATEPRISDMTMTASDKTPASEPQVAENLVAGVQAQVDLTRHLGAITSEDREDSGIAELSSTALLIDSPASQNDHLQPRSADDCTGTVSSAQEQRSISGGPLPTSKSFVMGLELKLAIQEGNLEKVQLLLRDEVDFNCYDETKCTPLHIAVEWRREEIVIFLLNEGARTNAKDVDAYNILHKLSMRPENPLSERLIDVLTRDRALINDKTNQGITPLMRSAVA